VKKGTKTPESSTSTAFIAGSEQAVVVSNVELKVSGQGTDKVIWSTITTGGTFSPEIGDKVTYTLPTNPTTDIAINYTLIDGTVPVGRISALRY